MCRRAEAAIGGPGTPTDRERDRGTAAAAVATLCVFFQETQSDELTRQACHGAAMNFQAIAQIGARARPVTAQIPQDAFLIG